jgi:hypothetical protein
MFNVVNTYMNLSPPIVLEAPAQLKVPRFVPGVLPSKEEKQAQLECGLSQVIELHTGKCEGRDSQLSFSHILIRKKLCTLQIGEPLSILFDGDTRLDPGMPSLPVLEAVEGFPSLFSIDYGRIPTEPGFPEPWTPELVQERKELISRLLKFRQAVPRELVHLIHTLGISRNHPELAVVASAVPEFLDLLRTNPQLSLLFVSNAFINSPEDPGFDEWRRLINKGARAIAAKLKLPRRPMILKLCRRIRINDVPGLERLQKVLKVGDYAEFLYNLNRPLADRTIHFLADFNVRLHPRFIRDLNEMELWDDGRSQERRTLMHDTLRLLQVTDNLRTRIQRIQSWNGLQQLHDAINNQLHGQSYECHDFNKPCPLECPDWIRPVESSEDLIQANKYFRNCSPVKSTEIAEGSYYIFIVSLSGFKRAMLGVALHGRKMIFEQLLYKLNEDVPDQLEEKIRAWVESTPWERAK